MLNEILIEYIILDFSKEIISYRGRNEITFIYRETLFMSIIIISIIKFDLERQKEVHVN